MKKKVFIIVAIFFMPYVYKALVRKNLSRCPIGSGLFYRTNASRVNCRCIFKKP